MIELIIGIIIGIIMNPLLETLSTFYLSKITSKRIFNVPRPPTCLKMTRRQEDIALKSLHTCTDTYWFNLLIQRYFAELRTSDAYKDRLKRIILSKMKGVLKTHIVSAVDIKDIDIGNECPIIYSIRVLRHSEYLKLIKISNTSLSTLSAQIEEEEKKLSNIQLDTKTEILNTEEMISSDDNRTVEVIEGNRSNGSVESTDDENNNFNEENNNFNETKEMNLKNKNFEKKVSKIENRKDNIKESKVENRKDNIKESKAENRKDNIKESKIENRKDNIKESKAENINENRTDNKNDNNQDLDKNINELENEGLDNTNDIFKNCYLLMDLEYFGGLVFDLDVHLFKGYILPVSGSVDNFKGKILLRLPSKNYNTRYEFSFLTDPSFKVSCKTGLGKEEDKLFLRGTLSSFMSKFMKYSLYRTFVYPSFHTQFIPQVIPSMKEVKYSSVEMNKDMKNKEIKELKNKIINDLRLYCSMDYKIMKYDHSIFYRRNGYFVNDTSNHLKCAHFILPEKVILEENKINDGNNGGGVNDKGSDLKGVSDKEGDSCNIKGVNISTTNIKGVNISTSNLSGVSNGSINNERKFYDGYSDVENKVMNSLYEFNIFKEIISGLVSCEEIHEFGKDISLVKMVFTGGNSYEFIRIVDKDCLFFQLNGLPEFMVFKIREKQLYVFYYSHTNDFCMNDNRIHKLKRRMYDKKMKTLGSVNLYKIMAFSRNKAKSYFLKKEDVKVEKKIEKIEFGLDFKNYENKFEEIVKMCMKSSDGNENMCVYRVDTKNTGLGDCIVGRVLVFDISEDMVLEGLESAEVRMKLLYNVMEIVNAKCFSDRMFVYTVECNGEKEKMYCFEDMDLKFEEEEVEFEKVEIKEKKVKKGTFRVFCDFMGGKLMIFVVEGNGEKCIVRFFSNENILLERSGEFIFGMKLRIRLKDFYKENFMICKSKNWERKEVVVRRGTYFMEIFVLEKGNSAFEVSVFDKKKRCVLLNGLRVLVEKKCRFILSFVEDTTVSIDIRNIYPERENFCMKFYDIANVYAHEWMVDCYAIFYGESTHQFEFASGCHLSFFWDIERNDSVSVNVYDETRSYQIKGTGSSIAPEGAVVVKYKNLSSKEKVFRICFGTVMIKM